jgi:hypothetical protein
MISVDEAKKAILACGGKYEYCDTGSPRWKRLFIKTNNNVTIGRVNLKDESVYNIKSYKKWYYDTIDGTDKIIMRLDKLLFSNVFITSEQFDSLIVKAKKLQIDDMARKQLWREAHPPRTLANGKKQKRKKLQNKNIRVILSGLLRSIDNEKQKTRYFEG